MAVAARPPLEPCIIAGAASVGLVAKARSKEHDDKHYSVCREKERRGQMSKPRRAHRYDLGQPLGAISDRHDAVLSKSGQSFSTHDTDVPDFRNAARHERVLLLRGRPSRGEDADERSCPQSTPTTNT